MLSLLQWTAGSSDQIQPYSCPLVGAKTFCQAASLNWGGKVAVETGDASWPRMVSEISSFRSRPNCHSLAEPRGFSKVPNSTSQTGNMSARFALYLQCNVWCQA